MHTRQWRKALSQTLGACVTSVMEKWLSFRHSKYTLRRILENIIVQLEYGETGKNHYKLIRKRRDNKNTL